MIDVPEVVRRRALAAGAGRWLAELPALVAGLERDWALEVGATFRGGTESFVAEARLREGTPAVLKVVFPWAGGAAANEIAALRLAGGEGCARLLRADASRDALLLERLGRPLAELRLPADRQCEILCSVAARLWRPAPGRGLPTGAQKGRWLVDHIAATWEGLGRPCTERAVAQALACAERRIAAHDDERAVLVHGDVHPWNALQAGEGFKLVDPDGLLAEAEYDLGVMLREDPVERAAGGDPRRRARWLASLAGRDAAAVWEWSVVERVSTGLACAAIGLQPVGGQMLATADLLAAS